MAFQLNGLERHAIDFAGDLAATKARERARDVEDVAIELAVIAGLRFAAERREERLAGAADPPTRVHRRLDEVARAVRGGVIEEMLSRGVDPAPAFVVSTTMACDALRRLADELEAELY